MELTGGNYGGYEVGETSVSLGDEVIVFTVVEDGVINVGGFLYNEDGIFVGQE
jgi:hypothetical protein